MYSLLHFTDKHLNEYVVISSGDVSPSEHARPGYELKRSIDLELGETGADMIALFPIDTPLMPSS